MEHQTEHFGTVPPDQVPEAYAAEPLSGPASDLAGESASGRAAEVEADGDLTLDADDDQMTADAGAELAFDVDDDQLAADAELAFDVDDEQLAADADAERAFDVGDDPADAGDERAADDELASIAAKRQATGEPRVDAALARLDDLAGLPVTEHRAVFEDVHRRLRDVLGELDTGQLPDAGNAGAESRRGR
jgi:hypothetical protein